MGLDQLKQEVIEEGRGHPFVEALVKDLRQRRQNLVNELVGTASAGFDHGTVCGVAGRARAMGDILQLITATAGVPE